MFEHYPLNIGDCQSPPAASLMASLPPKPMRADHGSNRVIQVYVTPAKYNAFKSAAEMDGQSLSSWMADAAEGQIHEYPCYSRQAKILGH